MILCIHTFGQGDFTFVPNTYIYHMIEIMNGNNTMYLDHSYVQLTCMYFMCACGVFIVQSICCIYSYNYFLVVFVRHNYVLYGSHG